MRKWLALFILLFAGEAQADFIPPVGLLPGQTYQLIFVTADTIAASSSNISTYNTFVQQEAAMDPSLPQGVTWNAVVSTSTVNANVNASAYSVPLYWTNGYQDSFGSNGNSNSFDANLQLYNSPGAHDIGSGGSIALMNLMVRYDQNGNFLTAPAGETPQEMGSMGILNQSPRGSASNSWYWGNPDPGSFVFTGSTGTGVASLYPAGSSQYVTDLAYGVPGYGDWTTNANISISPDTEQLHIFALSSPIVFEPEPSTLMLFLAGLLTLGLYTCKTCWK